MVQQLKEKFKEYTWMHNGSTTPTKMTSISNNIMSNSAGSSPVTKEKGQDTAAKRKEPDSSFSSLNVNKGPNTHIVYVRRKNISHVSDSSSSIKSVEANRETEPPKVNSEKTEECNSVAHAPENHSIRCTEPKNPESPSKIETEECNKEIAHLHEKNSEASIDNNSINCTEPKNPEIQNKTKTEVLKVRLDERKSEASQGNIANGIEPNNPQNPIDLETEVLKAISYAQKKNSDISHVHTVQVGDAYNPLKAGTVDLNTSADRSKISNVNVDFKKTSNSSYPNYPSRSNGSRPQVEVEKSKVLQNWEERYRKLQIFLNKCDQSSQEDYITMLRSLTATERSRHALELEKRALHLLLEEGKELSRMQVLNVLGQPSIQDRSSPSIQFEANYSQMPPYLRNKQ